MRKNVYVILGGSTGLGRAAAVELAKDVENHVIVTGRSREKLDDCVSCLDKQNLTVEAIQADNRDRMAVREVAQHAASIGRVRGMLNSAGISGGLRGYTPEDVLRINALGTINANMEFYPVLEEHGVIIDVASAAATTYTRKNVPPIDIYLTCLKDSDSFISSLVGTIDVDTYPDYARSAGVKKDAIAKGLAYGISKNFARWFSLQCALRFADKRIRVITLSPGAFPTQLTDPRYADDAAACRAFAEANCVGRMGHVEEFGKTVAFLFSDAAGFITASEVLIDGGSVTGSSGAPLLDFDS